MAGRKKKKPLSKAMKKLMGELIVTPLYVMKYQTWEPGTGVYGVPTDIYTDGTNVFEEQKLVPFGPTKSPVRYNNFVTALQQYVIKKFNPDHNPLDLYGDPPRVQLYDYYASEKYKPQLNRKHPWYKS